MSSLSEKNGFEWWAVCASKNAFKWTIDGFAAGTLSEEFMKTPEFLKAAEVWIQIIKKDQSTKH